jgi:hypothetical protein
MTLLVLALPLARCSGPPVAPSATPATPPTSPPPVPPAGLQPVVLSISPHVVSTAGSWGTITGTQFERGAIVRLGNAAVQGVVQDSMTIRFPSSGAHATGSVDVTVTNPGGFSTTLPNAYTYADPSAFDANGEWKAHADGSNEFLTEMHFIIRNNALVLLSCGTPVTMPTAVASPAGDFSFRGADGLMLTGTLGSMTTSWGQVVAPGCGDGRWWAEKSSSGSDADAHGKGF